MSFTDILKTPLAIAGIVGSLAIGGGAVIYVVQQGGSGTFPVSTATTPTFPMKFEVEYSWPGLDKKFKFNCDLSLDFTCQGGNSVKIRLHAADHSKVTVVLRTELGQSIDHDRNPRKSGVSWDDLLRGISIFDRGHEYFVQTRPL